jgi:DNA-directed RNA polymerase subunit RPC12/RpoP
MASGFVASLQIAPRDYHYTVCSGCGAKLYFTYVGENCPHCSARVTVFVEGNVPALNRMAEACLAAARPR